MWINEVGKHFLGAPFGGVKQSGIGREECFEEMLAFTQEKNIHVRLRAEAVAVIPERERSGEPGSIDHAMRRCSHRFRVGRCAARPG